MNKTIAFLLIALAINTFNVYAQKEHLVKYYKFQTGENALDKELRKTKISTLSAEEAYSFIERYNSLENIAFSRSKHYYIAHAYIQIGDNSRALDHFRKAFENGYQLSFLKKEACGDLYDSLEQVFVKASIKYQNSIDTVLRSKLEKMIALDQKDRTNRDYQKSLDSLNVIELKEIVEVNGWPGRSLVNDIYTVVMVLHMDEHNNHFFLDRIIEACANNLESWNIAEVALRNTLWRFERIDNHTKVKHIFFNNDGTLDIESSYLLLKTLENYLWLYPTKGVELFRTSLIGNISTSALYEIKDFLVRNGIPESQIRISEDIIEPVTDKIGFYPIAYKYFVVNI